MGILKDLIVQGFSRFIGNVSISTINGVEVGNNPQFTDNNTTYKFTIGTTTRGDNAGTDLGTLKSETATSGGTTLSLVTTGEKNTWNNKSTLALGTTNTTALRGDTKYAASSTAGGDATNADKIDGYHVVVVASMPDSPADDTIYIVK